MAARVAVAAAARAVTWVAAAAQRRSAKARVQRTAAEAADHAGRSDGAAAAAAALTSHASVSPRSSFQWMAPSAHRLRRARPSPPAANAVATAVSVSRVQEAGVGVAAP